MIEAKAILTARGGMTSHAAVVARGMGKPCVAGAQEISVDETAGHFAVNGKKVDIPSYRVTPGDVVTVKESSTDLLAIQHSIDTFGRLIPDWLEVSHGDRQVVVRDFPRRDQIDTAINEQLVVELYSK